MQGAQVDSPRFDSLVACQDTQLGFMVAEQNNAAVAGKCVFSGVLADAYGETSNWRSTATG